MDTIKEIAVKVADEYKRNLNKKLLLVDSLIVFALLTGIIQVSKIKILFL